MMDEFPHTIIFQSFTKISDGMGGYKEDWADAFSSDAHVQPLSSHQRALAGQLKTPITYRVYYPAETTGVKPAMRIKHHQETLDVASDPIDQGGLGEIMMIECERV